MLRAAAIHCVHDSYMHASICQRKRSELSERESSAAAVGELGRGSGGDELERGIGSCGDEREREGGGHELERAPTSAAAAATSATASLATLIYMRTYRSNP
jgi:hypothetical protein